MTKPPGPTRFRCNLYKRPPNDYNHLRGLHAADVAYTAALAVGRSLGKPCMGFEVAPLLDSIGESLGPYNSRDTVLAGAGRLGKALLAYERCGEVGVRIVAAFDVDERAVGMSEGAEKVFAMEKLPSLCQRMDIHIGAITVPAFQAQAACDTLVENGMLVISETNALRAVRHVTDGVSDLEVLRCKADYQNYFASMLQDNSLVWRTLLEFDYQLLLSRDHPLARRDRVDERELTPYTEIIHGDTAMPHMPDSVTETERGETPGNKKVQVYERGSQFDILARVPGTYMWVSPMPQDLLDRNGLVQRPCSHFNGIIIRRADHVFTALEKAFLSQLKKRRKTSWPRERNRPPL